jgi:hypothetical protein
MIYGKDSSIGSGSSDSDHNEDKKKGDACEGNVYIINNESRNIEISNEVKHVEEILRFNPMYNLCHVFPQHEIGIKGEVTNKFTDGFRPDEIAHDDAKEIPLEHNLGSPSIKAEAKAVADAKQNLHGTHKDVSQVIVNNTDITQSNAPTCKYVDINVQIDCWGDDEVSTTSSEFSVCVHC